MPDREEVASWWRLINQPSSFPQPWYTPRVSITDADVPFGPEEPEEEEYMPVDPGQERPGEDWWTGLQLPEGISWIQYPRASNSFVGLLAVDASNAASYPTHIVGLRRWAEENRLFVTIARTRELFVAMGYVSCPSRFYVCRAEEALRALVGQSLDTSEFLCPCCNQMHPAYTWYCQQTSRWLVCDSCARSVYGFEGEFFYEQNTLLCDSCTRRCSDPGCERITPLTRVFCSAHGVHENCAGCNDSLEVRVGEDVTWRSNSYYRAICDGCFERLCSNCDEFVTSPLTYSSDLDRYVCRGCFRESLIGGGTEEFDNGAGMTAQRLRIPAIPGRENVRLCGVEIEGANGDGDGDALAEAFYSSGLSSINRMLGYHRGGDAGFARVEHDSSVDWEAVIGPINPANRADVTRLNRAIRCIRSLVKEGMLNLDLRAGCHIHVEAARVSLDGAFNLNTLFSYVEDLMFRLGAARWPIHRAIVGSDYAQPLPKEDRKLHFARQHNSEGSRYYALSFINYFSQMLNGCSCGAVRYDSWQDCTCNLGKCTFEFRVFNTTANPRKLHAYMALTQALVAKALSLGTIESPAEEYPALSFVHKRFKDMLEAEQNDLISNWRTRLEWMFSELPLTDDEKESLLYCVRNSELSNVGNDFLNDLTAVGEQQVIEEVVA